MDRLLAKYIELLPVICAGSSAAAAAVESAAAQLQGKGWCFESLVGEIERALSLLTQMPRCVFDVGANKGSYSKALLQIYPDLEVHMFEPLNEYADMLVKAFQNNDKVYSHNIACSSAEGLYPLYSKQGSSGMTSLFKRDLTYAGIEFNHVGEAKCAKLDDYMNHYKLPPVIDLVKIDVEGAELDVLKGMQQLLKVTRVVQFEFGGTNIDSRTYFKDLFMLLRHASFDVYRMCPNGLIHIPQYSEQHEFFGFTIYVAKNRSL